MIHVLVADDHEIVRCGISKLLTSQSDFVVTGEAADGMEVLRLLENGVKADVLLADINMPGMNGIELMQKVRERYSDVKLVLLTMQDQPESVQKAFGVGVHNYLFKTAGAEEVIFAVRQAVSGKPYLCADLTERLINQSTSSFISTSTKNVDVEFSRREMEVLSLIAEGYTNEEAADKLFTSRRTVEGHRQAMIDKTGCRNSLALIRFAMRNGLLT